MNNIQRIMHDLWDKIDAAKKREDALKDELAQVREGLRELIDAMVQYEMDVEGNAPISHRNMMQRARAALAQPEQGEK